MRWQAVLIIGPTGCGKTPLGQLLEARGLGGRQCRHFDFGEVLRASVAGPGGGLTPGERDFVSRLLSTGALLDDAHFPIAEKLLAACLAGRQAKNEEALIVLNGLPRHAGQARAIAAIVDMRALISLECGPETAWQRIRANTGGDRGERGDDTLEEVKRRLEIFRRMTAPLLAYYRAGGVPVLPVSVGAKTTPEETRREVERQWSRLLASSSGGKTG